VNQGLYGWPTGATKEDMYGWPQGRFPYGPAAHMSQGFYGVGSTETVFYFGQSWSGGAVVGGNLEAQSWSGGAVVGGNLEAQSWSGGAIVQ
jgi:hypothetical protein